MPFSGRLFEFCVDKRNVSTQNENERANIAPNDKKPFHLCFSPNKINFNWRVILLHSISIHSSWQFLYLSLSLPALSFRRCASGSARENFARWRIKFKLSATATENRRLHYSFSLRLSFRLFRGGTNCTAQVQSHGLRFNLNKYLLSAEKLFSSSRGCRAPQGKERESERTHRAALP